MGRIVSQSLLYSIYLFVKDSAYIIPHYSSGNHTALVIYTICFILRDSNLEIDLGMVPDCDGEEGSDYECVLDLMVENMGRSNFGKPHEYDQKKGIWEGPVLLDNKPVTDWEIIPLEFKGDWINRYVNTFFICCQLNLDTTSWKRYLTLLTIIYLPYKPAGTLPC